MAFLDYNGLTHYNDNLNGKFNTKANVDGAYEGMTVGNAEQLISSVYTEDSVPYLFRTSGGSADIGDREFDELVGGTVAWNQLVADPSLATGLTSPRGSVSVADGIATITANGSGNTYAAIGTASLPANHVMLLSCDVKLDSANANDYPSTTLVLTWSGGFRTEANAPKGTWKTISSVVKPTGQSSAFNVYFFGTATTASGEKAQIKNPQIIDLTQLFGSTIADYIYSLEQSTSGSGVAFFRKLFPKPYYAYNSGELISSLPTAHETVGFNAWDEEWEVGAYDPSTGEKVANPNAWRSTNYIPVVPNTAYYFMSNFAIGNDSLARVWWYDADKNFITMNQGWNRTYTSPTNAYYCTFRIEGAHSDSDQVCINLSWDGEKDGEYEPYVKHTYPISEVAMHGIWKLDANNKIYCDGDIRKADGTLEKRYGIVDLGTLDWTQLTDASWNCFYTSIPTKANGSPNFICSKYARASIYNTTNDKCIDYNGTTNYIYIRDSSYSDAATFKTAMNGVYLVYELAEPTTETVDTFASPQIVDDFGTEEYVDTRDVPIPVGHNTKYTQNLRAKVEMSPDSPADNGDYLLRHANGENEYVPYIDRIPSAPSENGTYVLKCTVNGSTISYAWVAE